MNKFLFECKQIISKNISKMASGSIADSTLNNSNCEAQTVQTRKYHALLDEALSALDFATRSPSRTTHKSFVEKLGERNARKVLGDSLIENNLPLIISENLESFLTVMDKIYKYESFTKVDCSISVEELKNSKAIPSLRNNTKVFEIVHDSNAKTQKEKSTTLILKKGDICQLHIDAVVNPANERGLGCFVPEHVCLDNILHRRAGPRLREACRVKIEERREELKSRKNPEDPDYIDSTPVLKVGDKPFITSGFFLEAKNVIHATGPQMRKGDVPTEEQIEMLRKTYWNCLDAVEEHNNKCLTSRNKDEGNEIIRSIAFPCISTGLFGFPQKEASEIAMQTVMRAVRYSAAAAEEEQGRNYPIDTIIFDVFTEEDWLLYSLAFDALEKS